MAFYNTRVENTLSTLLDDGDSSIMCNFYLGAHRRNHHLTLTYTRGQLQSKITILGKDLTPVQRTMVLNRQDLFAGQQKHFVISDRLLMVRSCDFQGRWETTITELQDWLYPECASNVQIRESIPLSLLQFDAIVDILHQCVQLNKQLIEYEEDKPTIQMYELVDLRDPSTRPQLFLCQADAMPDDNGGKIITGTMYHALLELERNAIRRRGQQQPTWGASADEAIVIGDDHLPDNYDLQGLAPTHVVYEIIINRPQPREVAEYIAFRLFQKKIMESGPPDCMVYSVDDGIRSQEFINERWPTVQNCCTAILQNLRYCNFSPTENYIRDLLRDVRPTSPYHRAMNSLNYRGCLDEAQSLKVAMLDCIYDRFAPLYF